MTNRTRALLIAIGAGFVAGGVAVATLQVRRLGLPVMDGLSIAWWWPGALGGALLAHGFWAVYAGRTSRPTKILLLLNAAAWAGYLVLTPRLTPEELTGLDRLREQLGAADGISFIEDGPSMLAGRPSGFWSVNIAHSILKLFAGPAIEYGEFVVAHQFTGAPPTIRESYAIAILAFLWSAAFWAAVPPLLGLARNFTRRLTSACSRRRPGGS